MSLQTLPCAASWCCALSCRCYRGVRSDCNETRICLSDGFVFRAILCVAQELVLCHTSSRCCRGVRPVCDVHLSFWLWHKLERCVKDTQRVRSRSWTHPQSENTALHGCVNRQSHHDSQHGTHRSMRMYQTPSQGQGVEAIVQTSSTHSVMSVGLVERPIQSALFSKPSTTAATHTTMLPETAARPVSIMLAFLTTSRWDPRQTLADSALDNVAGSIDVVFPSRNRCWRSLTY